MSAISNLFGQAEAKLEIGDIKFEVVLPISGIVELDQQKDASEFKPDIVKVIVWFVDDRWFGNRYTVDSDQTKESKFQTFMQLVRKNEIQLITHWGLNHMNFNFAKIRRVENEFKKSIIVSSFDLEQHYSLEDKKKKREQITLADPAKTEDTVKATAAKDNAAQEDEEASNWLLDTINDYLKPFFTKKE